MCVASRPREIRMIASRVGLSSGWLPPRRDMRVAAKNANTVAPVSRTGLSAKLAQVIPVNWLRVDIACCSLKLAGFVLTAFRDSDAEPVHNDHGHEKSNRRTANDGRQNRHRLSFQNIQIGDHTHACRYK